MVFCAHFTAKYFRVCKWKCGLECKLAESIHKWNDLLFRTNNHTFIGNSNILNTNQTHFGWFRCVGISRFRVCAVLFYFIFGNILHRFYPLKKHTLFWTISKQWSNEHMHQRVGLFTIYFFLRCDCRTKKRTIIRSIWGNYEWKRAETTTKISRASMRTQRIGAFSDTPNHVDHFI